MIYMLLFLHHHHHHHKDLHRTGCDLFSGADASVNQALLKQVLLAFARWNKGVGYCQGFNILAAVILEVVEWKVEEALMVRMIFLVFTLLDYFTITLSPFEPQRVHFV